MNENLSLIKNYIIFKVKLLLKQKKRQFLTRLKYFRFLGRPFFLLISTIWPFTQKHGLQNLYRQRSMDGQTDIHW